MSDERVKLAPAHGAALHIMTAWSLPRSALSGVPLAVLARLRVGRPMFVPPK
jgi:hypothetical protein